jgi:thiamine-phosphate pyrophosphorylase
MSDETCRLYLITPPTIEVTAFSENLRSALGEGEVGALQLRLKGADDETICRAADALLPISHEYNVPLIMNDRSDLAKKTGCDGVHIGQQDDDYETARENVGSEGIVGVTCHDSRHLAMIAGERGADYVAFGAFFPTKTKEALYRPEVDIIEIWHQSMQVPSVAIGGIALDNCQPLVEAGADFLAVVSGVWDFPEGPGKAVAGFNRIFLDSSPSSVDTTEVN